MLLFRCLCVRPFRRLGLLAAMIFACGCPGGRVDEATVTLVATGSSSSADLNQAASDASTPDASAPAGSASEVSASDALQQRLRATLRQNLHGRRLGTDVNAAWQVMHGVLAYGREFTIATAAGPQPAVQYILGGGPIKGFQLRGGDRFDIAGESVRGVIAELEPGQKIGQGHRDQWVAYMANCGFQDSDQVTTADGPLTFQGWIRQIEWDVPRNFEGEYSWTLTALLAHRPTTHRWSARDGLDYSIESLLGAEVSQLAASNACGGSHRLCAIATALNRHRAAGLPITGVWSDAELVVEIAIEQSREFQNGDGSFSSHYFERPGWSPDLVTMLGTTGHVFEFLAVAVPDTMLREAWIQRAATTLCNVLDRTSHLDLECGALYHALSGLAIYERRLANSSIANESPNVKSAAVR